jgi:superfamily II DNA or RNA helicase
MTENNNFQNDESAAAAAAEANYALGTETMAQVRGLERRGVPPAETTPGLVGNFKCTLYRNQLVAVNFMRHLESHGPARRHRGGFVLDLMGLGKTSAILAHALDVSRGALSRVAAHRGTLIVASNTEVWMIEAERWLRERARAATRFLRSIDEATGATPCRGADRDVRVYIVAYSTLEALLKRARTCALFSHRWLRVVLDEAHHIGNANTSTHRACDSLPSFVRWAVTGTVWNNTPEETATIVRWVRQPYASALKSEEYDDLVMAGGDAGERLRAAFEEQAICRTRNEEVTLPPLHHAVVEAASFMLEQRVYAALRAKQNGLYMALRGRQAAVHLYLVLANDATLRRAWLRRYTRAYGGLRGAMARCCVPIERVVAIMCDCIYAGATGKRSDDAADDDNDDDGGGDGRGSAFIGSASAASMLAMSAVSRGADELMGVTHALARRESESASQEDMLADNAHHFMEWLPRFESSKVRALRLVYQRYCAPPRTAKMVVFSQWTRTLDLVAHILFGGDESRYVMYTGQVSREKQARRLARFQRTDDDNSSELRVLFSSLTLAESCSMTAAEHVVMLDLWWNEARQTQAVCRVYRKGQERPVTVHWIRDQFNSSEGHVEAVRRNKNDMRLRFLN